MGGRRGCRRFQGAWRVSRSPSHAPQPMNRPQTLRRSIAPARHGTRPLHGALVALSLSLSLFLSTTNIRTPGSGLTVRSRPQAVHSSAQAGVESEGLRHTPSLCRHNPGVQHLRVAAARDGRRGEQRGAEDGGILAPAPHRPASAPLRRAARGDGRVAGREGRLHRAPRRVPERALAYNSITRLSISSSCTNRRTGRALTRRRAARCGGGGGGGGGGGSRHFGRGSGGGGRGRGEPADRVEVAEDARVEGEGGVGLGLMSDGVADEVAGGARAGGGGRRLPALFIMG